MQARQPLRVAVLGGGALGLAAALRLATAGCQVTVIEREPHLGGLATGFRVGPSALERFYHHIFGTDTTIIRLIQDLGLGNKLVWQAVNTSTLWQGRIIRTSSPIDFLRVPFLPPVDRVRLLAALALLKLMPNERPFRGRTAVAWTRSATGDRVFQRFWQPLLRGKFGDRADEVAMSWLWSRFHERTFKLGYLRGGFQQMYDALGERIGSLGGQVVTGTSVTSVRHQGDRLCVETETGGTGNGLYDRVLATVPTPVFVRLVPQLPPSYVERYPGPDHYAAHVVILALDRALLDGVYWLNVADRNLPFLALVEHTSFLPAEDYGGRHLVYLGNYLPMNAPLFRASEARILEAYFAALASIRPGFDPAWVQEHWIFAAPFAQPIVTIDYETRLPPHRTPVPGLYLANMAHVYPQDRGQNYSLRLGDRLARTILADAR